MKKKQTRIVIAVVVWTFLIALVGMFVFFNDILLGGMTRSFRREVLQSEAVQLIEVVSVCGKLNGNGNGMNYFGAALVTAHSATDIDALVADLEDDFETVGYTVQEGVQVDVPHLEHRKLFFDYADFQDNKTYYCIYFYMHEHPNSNIFDIRGY